MFPSIAIDLSFIRKQKDLNWQIFHFNISFFLLSVIEFHLKIRRQKENIKY